MALKYTEDKLNSLDKGTIIQLFLSQQEQLENIDHNLQLVLEQLADLKGHRFGRSSERHEPEGQMSFMEVDGKIVFFNESEAVAAEGPGEDPEAAPSRKRKKKQGKREEDLEGLPVVVVASQPFHFLQDGRVCQVKVWGLSSKVCKFYNISLPAVFKAAGFTCRINTAHI